jgi:hypothetical protein
MSAKIFFVSWVMKENNFTGCHVLVVEICSNFVAPHIEMIFDSTLLWRQNPSK